MGNIGKRFANPNDWERLLTKFSEKQKLFWLYLNMRCDITGIHQLLYPVDSAYLGFSIDESFLEDFLQVVNKDKKRIEQLNDDRLWLIKFIRFQQVSVDGSLSDRSGPHIHIVKKLKEHGIYRQAVQEDPLLFEKYENPPESKELGSQYPNDSLPEEHRKGYSNSSSSGNGVSDGTGPPPANGKKGEPLFTVAERVLTAWPSGSSDVMFAETNAVEEILKDAQSRDIPIPEIESNLKAYLKGERMRIMETGEDKELIDIIEDFAFTKKETANNAGNHNL